MAMQCDILSSMKCEKCKTEMHKRGSKATQSNVQVYVCPKCGTVLYVDDDGNLKWET